MALVKRFVPNNNNNAICYYRYSSEAQREASIKQQKKAAEKYCKENGLVIIKEYKDEAISGSTDKRKEFQLMLEEVPYLLPHYLILWKTDRLSRDKIDAVLAKKLLRENGVEIIYVAEPMPDDEAERILIESIQEGLAQHFLIQHSKNVTRGMEYNAANFLYSGHKILGFKGKAESRYEIDPETAPVVKRIFNEYADGVSMKQIVDELNSAGLRTVKGNEFTINSLRHILQNRAYLGEYLFRGEYTKGGMPRIIDDDLFDRAQKKMALNKHGGNRRALKMHPETVKHHNDFWLTDFIKCGCCGGAIHGSSGTSSKGRIRYYYVCGNTAKKKDRCKLKYIPQETLEAIVGDFLDDLMREPFLRIAIAQKCFNHYKTLNRNNSTYIDVLRNNIKEVDLKLANLLKAVEKGIFNKTTAGRMKELEEQKALLEAELIVEMNKKENELTEAQILKFLDKAYDLSDIMNRRRLLDNLVDKIYLYEDKIVISCFYTDKPRTILFDEYMEHEYNTKHIEEILDTPKEFTDVPRDMLESIIGEADNFFGSAVL